MPTITVPADVPLHDLVAALRGIGLQSIGRANGGAIEFRRAGDSAAPVCSTRGCNQHPLIRLDDGTAYCPECALQHWSPQH